MRALVFEQYGDPAHVLRQVESPLPEPGPGEVRVRLAARPVNPSDLLFLQGRYGRRARFSTPSNGPGDAVPVAAVGFEGAGVVDASGPGTKAPEPGARVAVAATGTWQEYACASAGAVIAVGEQLSMDVACQMTVNPFTAHLALYDLGLREGDALLLTAGASAVSRMVVWIARRRGIRCYPVVRRAAQTATLARLGAEPLLARSERELIERVRESVGPGGVDAVLDAVGGAVGGAALRCVRPGGQFVVHGLLSDSPLPVPPEELIFRRLRISGFWLPERLERLDEAQTRRLTEEVREALATGLPGLDVAARYDLADVGRALDHMARPGRTGKVLLTG